MSTSSSAAAGVPAGTTSPAGLAADEPDETLASDDAADDVLAPRGPAPLRARTLGWLFVVLGGVGFLASAYLSIERYLGLVDPDHVAACSFNIFFDCGPAMGSWQGTLLGFPNPFLGVAAFPVVVTTGVVLLVGARLPRWYWLSLLGASTLGLGLVVFLVWTSLYALSVLCPACMVVWAVMIPLFWYQLVHAVQEGYLPAGEGLRRALVANRNLILAGLYVVLVGWILLAQGPAIVGSF